MWGYGESGSDGSDSDLTDTTAMVIQLCVVITQLVFFTVVAYLGGQRASGTHTDKKSLYAIGFTQISVFVGGILLNVVYVNTVESSIGTWMIFTSLIILSYILYMVIPSPSLQRLSFNGSDVQARQLGRRRRRRRPRVFTVDLERQDSPPSYKSMYGDEEDKPPDYNSDVVEKY